MLNTKKNIYERNSEFFYETLTGKGSLIFINNTQYQGHMKNWILESGPTNEVCQIFLQMELNMKEKSTKIK